MRVWVTKYALTKGIYQAEGEIKNYGHGDRFSVKEHCTMFSENEFFECKPDAIDNAQGRRRKRISSLEKQIDKLINLEF